MCQTILYVQKVKIRNKIMSEVTHHQPSYMIKDDNSKARRRHKKFTNIFK